jgi:hypothetical protein
LAINLPLLALIRAEECRGIEFLAMVQQLPKRRLVIERAIHGHIRKAASTRDEEPGLRPGGMSAAACDQITPMYSDVRKFVISAG